MGILDEFWPYVGIFIGGIGVVFGIVLLIVSIVKGKKPVDKGSEQSEIL